MKNEKEQNLKCYRYNNKAITLISLVITIIILLILAGISIGILTGDNGLFARAKQAKEETINAQENENIAIDTYNNTISKIFTEKSSNNENNTNIKIYINGVLSNKYPEKNEKYVVSKIECSNGEKGIWDYENWSLTISGIRTTNVECKIYFVYQGQEESNINQTNIKSYSSDGYLQNNVPGNALDNKMDNGNGRNWYGGTKLLVEYNKLSYINAIGVYTTNNWGYRFDNAIMYYSDDDSLTLESDLNKFKSVVISTENKYELSSIIEAKRVLLLKGEGDAVYEFQCFGKFLQ